VTGSIKIFINDTDSGICVDNAGKSLLLHGIQDTSGTATPQWRRNFERFMTRQLLNYSIEDRKKVMEDTYKPVVNAYTNDPAAVHWRLA
jgi:hypothetical protein